MIQKENQYTLNIICIYIHIIIHKNTIFIKGKIVILTDAEKVFDKT